MAEPKLEDRLQKRIRDRIKSLFYLYSFTPQRLSPAEAEGQRLIADRLQKLKLNSETATVQDVVDLDGHANALTKWCHGCERPILGDVVQVGMKPAPNSHTAHLCRACVQKALACFPEDARSQILCERDGSETKS